MPPSSYHKGIGKALQLKEEGLEELNSLHVPNIGSDEGGLVSELKATSVLLLPDVHLQTFWHSDQTCFFSDRALVSEAKGIRVPEVLERALPVAPPVVPDENDENPRWGKKKYYPVDLLLESPVRPCSSQPATGGRRCQSASLPAHARVSHANIQICQ